MTGHPPPPAISSPAGSVPSDRHDQTPSDAWIRRGCALVVAGVAAYSSYAHQRQFALDGGADQVTAALWPLSVDGLVILASTGLLKESTQSRRRARWTVRLAFLLGIAASLAANIAAAPSLTWQPILVAGWPPLALLLAAELVMHSRHGDRTHETAVSETTNETTDPSTHRQRMTRAVRQSRARDETLDDNAAEMGEPRVIATSGTEAAATEEMRPDGARRRSSLGQPPCQGRPTQPAAAETVMWAHYETEKLAGRTPSGAELDRVAGTNNYGRAVLARWRRTGRIPTAVAS